MRTLLSHQHELIPLVPLFGFQLWMAWYALRQLLPRRGKSEATALCSAFALAFVALLMVTTSPIFGVSAATARVLRILTILPSLRTLAMLWLFGSAPAFLLFLLYRRAAVTFNPARRGLVQAVGTIAVATPFALEAFGSFIGRTSFQVREVDLPVANLHPDLQNLRILQLSDVHLSSYLTEAEFARVVDEANGLHPHIALMTGDLISTAEDPVDQCIRQLARVRADAPLLGCMGNHESYAELKSYVQVQCAKRGMNFLRQQNCQLRFGQGVLNFGGIDYQPFSRRGHYLPGVDRLLVSGMPNLLLSHNPDVFPEAVEQGWDSTLAGHTHGGQVTLEILSQTLNPARFYTPFVSGLYQRKNSTCYVTRGIGTIGIPARVGALPEITLLRLRKA